jgi:hypothetical protein
MKRLSQDEEEMSQRLSVLTFLTTFVAMALVLAPGVGMFPDSGNYYLMSRDIPINGYLGMTSGWYHPGYPIAAHTISTWTGLAFIQSASIMNALSIAAIGYCLMIAHAEPSRSNNIQSLTAATILLVIISIMWESSILTFALSEPIFVSLLVGCTTSIYLWRVGTLKSGLGIAAFLACLSFIIRPTGAAACITVVVVAALQAVVRPRALIDTLRSSLGWIIVATALFAGFILSNYSKFGYFIRTSYGSFGEGRRVSYFSSVVSQLASTSELAPKSHALVVALLIIIAGALVIAACNWRDSKFPYEHFVLSGVYFALLGYAANEIGFAGYSRYTVPGIIVLLASLPILFGRFLPALIGVMASSLIWIGLGATFAFGLVQTIYASTTESKSHYWQFGASNTQEVYKLRQHLNRSPLPIYALRVSEDDVYNFGIISATFPELKIVATGAASSTMDNSYLLPVDLLPSKFIVLTVSDMADTYEAIREMGAQGEEWQHAHELKAVIVKRN